jgi:hypothetical protein
MSVAAGCWTRCWIKNDGQRPRSRATVFKITRTIALTAFQRHMRTGLVQLYRARHRGSSRLPEPAASRQLHLLLIALPAVSRPPVLTMLDASIPSATLTGEQASNASSTFTKRGMQWQKNCW